LAVPFEPVKYSNFNRIVLLLAKIKYSYANRVAKVRIRDTLTIWVSFPISSTFHPIQILAAFDSNDSVEDNQSVQRKLALSLIASMAVRNHHDDFGMR
jgi:hypothetical protein